MVIAFQSFIIIVAKPFVNAVISAKLISKSNAMLLRILPNGATRFESLKLVDGISRDTKGQPLQDYELEKQKGKKLKKGQNLSEDQALINESGDTKITKDKMPLGLHFFGMRLFLKIGDDLTAQNVFKRTAAVLDYSLLAKLMNLEVLRQIKKSKILKGKSMDIPLSSLLPILIVIGIGLLCYYMLF